MTELYAIQMKKTVYKPMEVPYFVSPSPVVASWFFNSTVVTADAAVKRMVRINPEWGGEVEPFKPYAEFAPISPSFSMFPLYVLGQVGKKVLADGTTYYNWFTPRLTVLNLEEAKTYQAEQYGCDAYVQVLANFFHEHHIFRNWKPLN